MGRRPELPCLALMCEGHASFADSLEACVRQAVRRPAAVLLYLLERLGQLMSDRI